MLAKPEIIAHRGASRERPENTVAAFLRAVELGAGAVELDVHLTADGSLVVHHDPALAGPAGHTPIRSLTLASVRAFRVRGEPVPTLSEVIAAIDGRARIYCELKGLGTALGGAAAMAPLGDRGAVHSFDHRMVAEARRLMPQVCRGVLESSYHLDPIAALKSVDARDLWENEAVIDADLVSAVHAAGGRVIAWTVNDPARGQELASIGVDGLCTDDAAGIGAALNG